MPCICIKLKLKNKIDLKKNKNDTTFERRKHNIETKILFKVLRIAFSQLVFNFNNRIFLIKHKTGN